MRSSTKRGGEIWAIVLAGGDGRRLHSLTDDGAGNPIPKQFCSLAGAESLAAHTLARARSIVDPARVTVVVSAPHERYWHSSLRDVSPANIVVQPCNRGTALGILLPALRIFARDPDARILILPSDQYVANESVLEAAMRKALHAVQLHRRGVALLGIEADEADPELGYIVPEQGAQDVALRSVRRFVEKPPVEEARRLCREGALWNSFIIACRAESLLELHRSRCPHVLESLQRNASGGYRALADLYERLPMVDFSRHIAITQEERLTVMPVPRCGWSDLGTPERLAQTLTRYPTILARASFPPRPTARGHVNLAERLLRACPNLNRDLAIGAEPGDRGSVASDPRSFRPTEAGHIGSELCAEG